MVAGIQPHGGARHKILSKRIPDCSRKGGHPGRECYRRAWRP